MNDNNIKPEKITKPIQLLAAWLIGLVLLESSLLTAAGTITKPDWLPVLFGISAVAIIPVFLLMIFLLQTRFRPEMQEDSYYSKYLDKNSMTYESLDSGNEIETYRNEIIKITAEVKNDLENIKKVLKKDEKNPKSKEIEEIVNESDKKFEELKKLAKFSAIDLRINQKLTNYPQILDVVSEYGFTNFRTFGGRQVEHFVMSFGKNIPIDMVRDLVFQLVPLGLQYIKLTIEVPDEDRDNRIYIGSYATSDKISISEKIITKLNNLSNDKRFIDLIK